MTLINDIKRMIEECLDAGKRKFIIYPFGDIGIQVKHVLNDGYGIKEEFILDNHMCEYNKKIKPFSHCKRIDCKEYVVMLSSVNQDIYQDLKKNLERYFPPVNIRELSCMAAQSDLACQKRDIPKNITKVGKYSYGPLCSHFMVESVGAFCGFAEGTDVVMNHSVDYITTHPMISVGRLSEN